ncbi:MAG: hypothetical protein R3B82_28685 [Sandaracinaceae bacterium]
MLLRPAKRLRWSDFEAFELLEAIGPGAAGTVWRAKRVAPPRARVDVEVLAAGDALPSVPRLTHPSIVRALWIGVAPDAPPAGVAPGAPFVVTEPVEGHALSSMLGTLRWPHAQRVLHELLEALAHAHARGVVHGAVTPDNVFCEIDGGRARLRGFGYARPTDAATPYRAPEQLEGADEVGPAADLYAVGCLAWALLTGAPPFRGPRRRVHEQHRRAPLPKLAPRAPVPREAEAWLRSLLAKAPADRVASAEAAIAALDELGPVSSGVIRVERPPISDVGEELGSIGRHLAMAGEDRRALEPLVEGAEARVRAGDLDGAEALLELHAEVCARLGPRTRHSRIRAAIVRCELLDLSERWAELAWVIAEAETEIGDEDLAEQAELSIQEARFLRRLGRHLEEHAVLACAEVDARLAERADLLVAITIERAWACFDEGRLERAGSLFGDALARAEDRPRLMARAIEGLANVERARGEPALAMAHALRSAELYARERDLRGSMTSAYWLGALHLEAGDADLAIERLERARVLAERFGNDSVGGMAQVRIGQAFLQVGDVEGARHTISSGLAAVERAGRPALCAAARVHALETQAVAADWPTFAALAQRATELLAETGVADTSLARAAERAGDAASDAGRLEEATLAYAIARDQWATLRPDGLERRRMARLVERLGQRAANRGSAS